MMRNYFFLPILLLLSCCFACNEDPIIMLYDQTKCSDPWGNGENNDDISTAQAVTIYFFETHEVTLQNVALQFDEELAQACEACMCTTGNQIRVSLEDEDDVASLEAEGFVRL